MPDLQSIPAHRCLTVVGMLVNQGKVLLVKHKKLGIWLFPGGHVEPDELPHQAAEREFFEETGIHVKAIDLNQQLIGTESEYLPNPVATNLHWISKAQYQARQQAKPGTVESGKRQCEQHYVFLYVVIPVGKLQLTQNTNESTDIGWFNRSQIETLETTADIKQEIGLAFSLAQAAKGPLS